MSPVHLLYESRFYGSWVTRIHWNSTRHFDRCWNVAVRWTNRRRQFGLFEYYIVNTVSTLIRLFRFNYTAATGVSIFTIPRRDQLTFNTREYDYRTIMIRCVSTHRPKPIACDPITFRLSKTVDPLSHTDCPGPNVYTLAVCFETYSFVKLYPKT